MMPTSNRSTSSQPLSASEEMELAQELLRIQNEEELDHFLPLLIPAIQAAAPLLMKAAGPILKGLASSFLGGGRRRRPRPDGEQEQFFGGIVGKLFGEVATESEEEEQFLGGIVKGLLGGEMEAEQEQFLGGLVGKLFGGEMEFEGGNYVQEQFLGGILKGIMGGEMEHESGGPGVPVHVRRARRFVRLATRASRHAAHHIMKLLRSGKRPTLAIVRRIVAGAILHTARRMFHHHHHHHRQMQMQMQPPQGAPPQPPQGGPPGGETLLGRMVANARPIATG